MPARLSLRQNPRVRACTMESHSRMLARNWFPRPSPLLAPFTRPAMSTNSTEVGMTDFDFEMPLSTCNSTSQLRRMSSHMPSMLLPVLAPPGDTDRQPG